MNDIGNMRKVGAVLRFPDNFRQEYISPPVDASDVRKLADAMMTGLVMLGVARDNVVAEVWFVYVRMDNPGLEGIGGMAWKVHEGESICLWTYMKPRCDVNFQERLNFATDVPFVLEAIQNDPSPLCYDGSHQKIDRPPGSAYGHVYAYTANP